MCTLGYHTNDQTHSSRNSTLTNAFIRTVNRWIRLTNVSL